MQLSNYHFVTLGCIKHMQLLFCTKTFLFLSDNNHRVYDVYVYDDAI